MLQQLKNIGKRTDWLLLICLLLVSNQAVFTLKIVGLLFIYVLRPNFQFGFRKGRIPYFYLAIIGLSFINLAVHIPDHSSAYLSSFALAMFFWLACILSHHQLKLSIEKFGKESADATLKSFTLINLVFCFYQIAKMSLLTHHLNPYNADIPFPFGLSAGDKVFGAFMELSLINMMVSALLAIYFIYKRNILFTLLSTTSLMLVFSNQGIVYYLIVLLGILLIFLVVKIFGKRQSKNNTALLAAFQRVLPDENFSLFIPLVFIFIIFIYQFVSPENFIYATEKINALFTTNETKEGKQNESLNLDSCLNSYYIISGIGKKVQKTDKNNNEIRKAYEKAILDVCDKPNTDSNRLKAKSLLTTYYLTTFSGKRLALKETFLYLKSSPMAFLLGAGPNRFSSKLAQQISGLDSSRIFKKYFPSYSAPLYNENHRLLILNRKQCKNEMFSNINWPDCLYNQIFGEYGFLGFILFLLFYVGYYLRQFPKMKYGIWLCALMVPFAYTNYLFESLSVLLFFEFLLALENPEYKA